MQLLHPFDATQVEPQGNSKQLPVSPSEGWPVVITASEICPTKNNDGGYLKLEITVIEGEHKGESADYRLNLYNQSDKAKEIAYRQLSALCHVTGVFQLMDSAQLHNIPFRAVVGLQKKQKEDDPDYTEVKGVKDIQGNDPGKAKAPAPAPAAPVQQPAQPAAPAAPAGAPAWGNPAPAPATNPAPSPAPAWGNPAPAGPAAGAPPWGK